MYHKYVPTRWRLYQAHHLNVSRNRLTSVNSNRALLYHSIISMSSCMQNVVHVARHRLSTVFNATFSNYLTHLCAGNGIHVAILFYEHPSVDNPFPVAGCRCLNVLKSLSRYAVNRAKVFPCIRVSVYPDRFGGYMQFAISQIDHEERITNQCRRSNSMAGKGLESSSLTKGIAVHRQNNKLLRIIHDGRRDDSGCR